MGAFAFARLQLPDGFDSTVARELDVVGAAGVVSHLDGERTVGQLPAAIHDRSGGGEGFPFRPVTGQKTAAREERQKENKEWFGMLHSRSVMKSPSARQYVG